MYIYSLLFAPISHTILGDSDWITAVFLLVIILITLLFTLHRRKMILMLQSLFSPRHFSQLSREGKIFTERIFLLDIAVIFLVQALFCYLIVKFFFPHIYHFTTPFLIFLITLSAVALDYLLKLFFTFTFTYLFDCQKERTNYYSYKLFYQTTNSLSLFLILLLVVYMGYIEILLLYIPIFLTTFTIMTL